MALEAAEGLRRELDIEFAPGLNEELAATAIWGSQQAMLEPSCRFEGVFGLWYGKGPGVDRATDALKHGNSAGTTRHGGVLVLAGDDPGAKSSTLAHQSESALIHCGIPILHPADVQDVVDFGAIGFALSRFSGAWAALKCMTDVVDSSRTVDLGFESSEMVLPELDEPPQLYLSDWEVPPLMSEERLLTVRLPRAQAFARANRVDRVVGSASGSLGIVASGKAFHDVRQALLHLGIDDARAQALGIAILKVGLVWPLEAHTARDFARGRSHLLVVEEKSPIVEQQLARLLVNETGHATLEGKLDDRGEPLIPVAGELEPLELAAALRRWLLSRGVGAELPEAPQLRARLDVTSADLTRTPAFCAGCPHNTSTLVPEGSLAMGGIGCHGMAAWMPERHTVGYTQMGGEGATWIGRSPFVERDHVFQNMGDGTYFHSGVLAVRAAVAAGVHMTFKILANGSAAMTGGQVLEGHTRESVDVVSAIVAQLRAEGVQTIAVISGEPDTLAGALPSRVELHDRSRLEEVQRRFRDAPAVSAIVYDQVCAAEARRLRKRGQMAEPEERIVINELVCEGCGDCNVVSNCIAVEPIETELGRKRTINQSACNKDYSCLGGYCPSFATVTGAAPRASAIGEFEVPFDVPDPTERIGGQDPVNILVAGIGGTGVVTVGALLGMAAHLEGLPCSVLDVTGLAQKNGPVTSEVRVATDGDELGAARIPNLAADVVLGCDPVVAAAPYVLDKLHGSTDVIVDTRVAPTAAFAQNPDLVLGTAPMTGAIERAIEDPAHLRPIPATELAESLFGDAIYANPLLLGYALQLGLLPVSLSGLERAVELNGRDVEVNKRALHWGRAAAVDLDAALRAFGRKREPASAETPVAALRRIVADRRAFLVDYQDEAYAGGYERQVRRFQALDEELGKGRSLELSLGVARYYFKLLAYKDEYEVARLWTSSAFSEQLASEFEGTPRVEIHLAPQMLNRRDRRTGRAKKIRFGPWVRPVLELIARGKRFRGTALDIAGKTAHRRWERSLIREYEQMLDRIAEETTAANYEVAVELAELPEQIRGYDTVKEATARAAQERRKELLGLLSFDPPVAVDRARLNAIAGS